MRRPLLALAILLVAAGAAAATFFLRDRAYRGSTLPGVRVAAAHLDAAVPVLANGHRIELVPGRVLRLDAVRTRGAALAAGRGSVLDRALALLLPVAPTRTVQPVLRARADAWQELVERLDGFGKAPRPATVGFDGVRPVVTSSRAGTAVDRAALRTDLVRHVETGHSVIHARYVRAAPAIGDAAARTAAARAARLVSAPIRLTVGGEAVGMLSPDQLAPLVRFRAHGSGYLVGFGRQATADAVRPLVARWRREPVDASFGVAGGRAHVVPARDGRDVDPWKTAAALRGAAQLPGRFAAVGLRATPARLTTARARALGITRELVSYTTQMGPSSSNRIHNVHLMADFIDGTVLKPGQVFSYNRIVGPRTAERGFLEGQEIVGSLTIPSIGGGVCQTATTLFNDAFELGLPIIERHNHSYYLYHYPLGRDATVSWGGPDLKFRNDLKSGLLIKTSYTDSTLTFAFYGAPAGRRAVASPGPQVNWTQPSMSYAVDPQAPPGSVDVVAGSGEQGFDMTVGRTVYEHGKLLRRDSFSSHYIPVGPTTVYGPGRTPPGPYVVLPPH